MKWAVREKSRSFSRGILKSRGTYRSRKILFFFQDRDSEPIPGKYAVVELTHTAKPEVKKEEPEVKEEPKKEAEPEKKTRGRKKKAEVKKEEPEEEIEQIDEKVKDLMRCICDEDIHLGLLRQLKFNEEYGKPIGKLFDFFEENLKFAEILKLKSS